MSNEKDDLTGENVHGVKNRWFKFEGESDPFVKSETPEPAPAPEPAPEPVPEPVVTPEPVAPEKPAENDEVLSAAQLIQMAKHYRKVNGVSFADAEKALRDDPALLEEYKNLKKW